MGSLWGDEFVIEPTPKAAKKIIEKVKSPKAKVEKSGNILPKAKVTKSVSISDVISSIRKSVFNILGRYEDATKVITSREDLHSYISFAITNGVIAVDTETNNTLQPVGCKLMGLCLYTPGLKNVYIPVNHVDLNTRCKLENQVSEQDIYEEMSRIDSSVKVIVHNGKFDYQVLKYTTGLRLPMYWDTIIAARLLNENERSNLKLQYKTHIDPTIEKYSIDYLFEDVPYELLDPALFALYAATDAYMTYQLYLYQEKEFNLPENRRLFTLFKDIEMPDVEVVAEMEYKGVELCVPYADRLKVKYGNMLSDIQQKIDDELLKYTSTIEEWRKTPEANHKEARKDKAGNTVYKQGKNGQQIIEYSKSKSEQLPSLINVGSSTQLAILLYDVLKTPVVDKRSPRSTKEEILVQIDIPLCKLILEYRGLSKLISTYIDALPLAVNPIDGRIHTQYNQIGAGTGRVSSEQPNLQNIPSNNRELRMLFKASDVYNSATASEDDKFIISKWDEVETLNGWVSINSVAVGDILIDSDNNYVKVTSIQDIDNDVCLSIADASEYCSDKQEVISDEVA